MERSQTAKLWGVRSGVPSPRDRSCLSPAPSEGRPYLEPRRTHRRPRGAGAGPGDQAGAEGGVPALGRRREAAARAGPRAAARATGDLRPGRTTGSAAGATGRRPAEGGPRMAWPGSARRRYGRPSPPGSEKLPGPWRAHATAGPRSCERHAGGDPGAVPPPPTDAHTPALAPELTSPGAPGAGAPALTGAAGPGGRGGGGGSCWLRRAICRCSRSTSRWDSRSSRSKSRTWSHWGPS